MHKLQSIALRFAIAMTAVACFVTAPVQKADAADVLMEWFFWHGMGEQVGQAASSYADYQQERALWREKIAAANAELERCGGCASAQKELDYWQGIENQFQDVAGELAQTAGMPPNVAAFLGIDMPPVPAMTEAQLEEHRIIRPKWLDSRPDFCRQAGEAYLSCLQDFQVKNGLLADVESTWQPGGLCYDPSKLNRSCFAEDYGAFQREQKIQARRANGEIIPEYIAGASSQVYFGEVPDNFIPDYPPTDVVREALAQPLARIVRFTMRKKAVGVLDGFTIQYFNSEYVAPENQCHSVHRTLGEVERRECEDYYEYEARYRDPMLFCYYTRQGGSREELHDVAMYWYGRRPEYADPDALLTRSHAHPVLRLGEPRADCPATKADADRIGEKYAAALKARMAAVPQIPAGTVLPESDWVHKRQEDYDAKYKDRTNAIDALDGFPLEGVYSFEVDRGGTTRDGTCAIVHQPFGAFFSIACDQGGIPMPASSSMYAKGTNFGLRWPENLLGTDKAWTSWLGVDLAYRADGRGDALSTFSGEDPKVRMVRTGDLPPFGTFQIEGVYELELIGENARAKSKCTIRAAQHVTPPDYKVECASDGGPSFKARGAPVFGEAGVLWITSFSKDVVRLNGYAAGKLFFLLNPAYREDRPESAFLIGHEGTDPYGPPARVEARLTRTGDLEAIEPDKTPPTPFIGKDPESTDAIEAKRAASEAAQAEALRKREEHRLAVEEWKRKKEAERAAKKAKKNNSELP